MKTKLGSKLESKLESLFRAIVFAVFCITAWFAIPGTFWPHAVLDVLGIPVPRDLVWAGFAFQLAFLVALYSLPVMIDWRRYSFNAVLCGGVHLALAIFWWFVYPTTTGTSMIGMGWCEFLMGAALLGTWLMLWSPKLNRIISTWGVSA